MVEQWGRPQRGDRLAKGLADFDFRSLRRLERTRLLVRAGPALGLMGTLIPLSPALEGLANGDTEELSDNLRVAFSVTVIGLLIGAVAFAISLVRDRLYGQDLSDLEFVAATIAPDAGLGSGAVAAGPGRRRAPRGAPRHRLPRPRGQQATAADGREAAVRRPAAAGRGAGEARALRQARPRRRCARDAACASDAGCARDACARTRPGPGPQPRRAPLPPAPAPPPTAGRFAGSRGRRTRSRSRPDAPSAAPAPAAASRAAARASSRPPAPPPLPAPPIPEPPTQQLPSTPAGDRPTQAQNQPPGDGHGAPTPAPENQ